MIMTLLKKIFFIILLEGCRENFFFFPGEEKISIPKFDDGPPSFGNFGDAPSDFEDFCDGLCFSPGKPKLTLNPPPTTLKTKTPIGVIPNKKTNINSFDIDIANFNNIKQKQNQNFDDGRPSFGNFGEPPSDFDDFGDDVGFPPEKPPLKKKKKKMFVMVLHHLVIL